MRTDEVLTAVGRALQQSSAFDGGSYIYHLADFGDSDTGLTEPVVEIRPERKARADSAQSDRVGYTTDADDNRTGRVFRTGWELEVAVTIYVSAGNSEFDPTQLGYDLETALLPYDSKQLGQNLPDGDGGTVPDVTRFRVGEGHREDDLDEQLSRRWKQVLHVDFHDTVTTSDPTITTVESPQSDEVTTDDTADADLVWNN
jgi:hypothetical protein